MNSERGAILIMTALVMMLLLFIAAFATDLGAWYRQGQAQQQAADVSSLNGMQAYDRAAKAYFTSVGATNWNDLTPDQQEEGERRAMAEALNTIMGLLETSGYSFTQNAPVEVQLAPPPNNPGDETIYTIEADDGTIVTVTRSNVTNPDGTVSSGMSVTLTDRGKQYFSGLLRDAPTITRDSTAVLSNCGAECNRSITIYPPFAGFNASGDGDGFAPLLFNKDGVIFNGYEEIWAINHHVSNVETERNSDGDIICMDTATKEACLGGTTQFDLDVIYNDLQTHNRGIEYIDSERGLILFGGRDAGLKESGIVCFDARERQFCETKFLPMFDASQGPTSDFGWGAWINVTGPFRHGNKFYLFNQAGEWACATLSDDPNSGNTTLSDNCGSGNTPAANYGGMPLLNPVDPANDKWFISHGEQIGNKLYMRQTRQGGQRFYCFDMDNPGTPCWGGDGLARFDNWGYHADSNLTFFGRNSAGDATHICVMRLHKDNATHACVRLTDAQRSWNTFGDDFNAMVRDLSTGRGPWANSGNRNSGWGGDTLAWSSASSSVNRLFIAGGESNNVGCWDWATGNCGVLETNSAFTGSSVDWIAPYALAEVSNQCIIGLSHNSVFFSFNPMGLSACVDTQVGTEIFPCECANGDNRWGEIRMPADLISKVNRMEATVSATPGGPPIASSLDGVDLLPSGVLDLSAVPNPQSHDTLYLVLDVDAKLDPATNKPVWQSPIDVDLKIVVQPTLAG